MSRMIPRGHEVAGLGRRFLAFLIDVAPVAIIGGLTALVLQLWHGPTVVLVSSIAAAVLTLGYGLYQWWAYATGGAGIGARATGLELVGMSDGTPIGWWRVFLRFLVYLGLMLTVVGGIAFLVFLIIHERRQGWHDMAVKAVLVQPKPAEVRPRRSNRAAKAAPSTVGLPPHLAEAFSPEASRYAEESAAAWGPQADQPSEQEPWQQPAPWEQPVPQWGQQSGPQAQPGRRAQGRQGQGRPGSQPSAAERPGPQPSPLAPPDRKRPPMDSSTPQPPSRPASGPGPLGPGEGLASPHPDLPMRGGQPFRQPSRPSGPAMPSRGPGWIPMPTPSSVLQPSQRSVRVRQRDFGEVDDDEGTRIAALPQGEGGRRGDEGWYLRLDDGREVDLAVTVLLGRNPQRTDDDPEVQLVPSSGDGRMISRTHVLIGTDPRGVYVVDRGSTNGTALVGGAGELEPAPAGVQMRVREGQQVSYGNRWFTVLRRPAQLG